MINVLGFCASPRIGNSLFLLNKAIDEIKIYAKYLGEEVSTETCSVRGKKISGCIMCQGCMKDGICLIKDDFKEMQDMWLKADVIIYSVPVYHMGMPAQMKAFIDRLGNSMFGRYKEIFPDMVTAPKPLKVIGCIAQGIHSFSGQEHTITQVINHTMICGCVPVAGDLWESYIGAGGWTANEESRNALEKQYENGTEDSRIVVSSSQSLARRALDMAILLKNGGINSQKVVDNPVYIPFNKNIHK